MYKLVYGVCTKMYAVLVGGKIIGIAKDTKEADDVYMRYVLEEML